MNFFLRTDLNSRNHKRILQILQFYKELCCVETVCPQALHFVVSITKIKVLYFLQFESETSHFCYNQCGKSVTSNELGFVFHTVFENVT